MRDENDGADVVHLGKKSKLLLDAARVPVCGGTSGEHHGAAGTRQAVVSWQSQSMVEKVVHLVTDASVGAINGCREDPFADVRH